MADPNSSYSLPSMDKEKLRELQQQARAQRARQAQEDTSNPFSAMDKPGLFEGPRKIQKTNPEHERLLHILGDYDKFKELNSVDTRQHLYGVQTQPATPLPKQNEKPFFTNESGGNKNVRRPLNKPNGVVSDTRASDPKHSSKPVPGAHDHSKDKSKGHGSADPMKTSARKHSPERTDRNYTSKPNHPHSNFSDKTDSGSKRSSGESSNSSSRRHSKGGHSPSSQRKPVIKQEPVSSSSSSTSSSHGHKDDSSILSRLAQEHLPSTVKNEPGTQSRKSDSSRNQSSKSGSQSTKSESRSVSPKPHIGTSFVPKDTPALKSIDGNRNRSPVKEWPNGRHKPKLHIPERVEDMLKDMTVIPQPLTGIQTPFKSDREKFSFPVVTEISEGKKPIVTGSPIHTESNGHSEKHPSPTHKSSHTAPVKTEPSLTVSDDSSDEEEGEIKSVDNKSVEDDLRVTDDSDLEDTVAPIPRPLPALVKGTAAPVKETRRKMSSSSDSSSSGSESSINSDSDSDKSSSDEEDGEQSKVTIPVVPAVVTPPKSKSPAEEEESSPSSGSKPKWDLRNFLEGEPKSLLGSKVSPNKPMFSDPDSDTGYFQTDKISKFSKPGPKQRKESESSTSGSSKKVTKTTATTEKGKSKSGKTNSLSSKESSTAPRGRGRPPGSTNKDKDESKNSTPSGRGRKKASSQSVKYKSKATISDTSDSDSDSCSEIDVVNVSGDTPKSTPTKNPGFVKSPVVSSKDKSSVSKSSSSKKSDSKENRPSSKENASIVGKSRTPSDSVLKSDCDRSVRKVELSLSSSGTLEQSIADIISDTFLDKGPLSPIPPVPEKPITSHNNVKTSDSLPLGVTLLPNGKPAIMVRLDLALLELSNILSSREKSHSDSLKVINKDSPKVDSFKSLLPDSSDLQKNLRVPSTNVASDSNNKTNRVLSSSPRTSEPGRPRSAPSSGGSSKRRSSVPLQEPSVVDECDSQVSSSLLGNGIASTGLESSSSSSEEGELSDLEGSESRLLPARPISPLPESTNPSSLPSHSQSPMDKKKRKLDAHRPADTKKRRLVTSPENTADIIEREKVSHEDDHEWDRKHPARSDDRRGSSSNTSSHHSHKDHHRAGKRARMSDTSHDSTQATTPNPTSATVTTSSTTPSTFTSTSATVPNSSLNSATPLPANRKNLPKPDTEPVQVNGLHQHHIPPSSVPPAPDPALGTRGHTGWPPRWLPNDKADEEALEHADEYHCRAKKFKYQADAMVDSLQKNILYLEAVLSFMQCGYAMEREPWNNPNADASKMYKETHRFVTHGCRFRSNQDQDTPEKAERKLSVLSLRIQSLLSLKLYAPKKTEALKLKRILEDHYKTFSSTKPPVTHHAPSPHQTNWNRSTGTPSPMSPTPSPVSSVCSVGSAGSVNDLTPSKLTNGTGGCGMAGSGQIVPHGSVAVTQRIHSVTQQYFTLTSHLVQSYDLWEQSESAITPDIRDFFAQLDLQCGPLSMQSSILHVVRYVKQGIQNLRVT